jgi:hypothetical protein
VALARARLRRLALVVTGAVLAAGILSLLVP